MARTYDFTRFVMSTIVTVKTVDDEFNVVETSFTINGLVSTDEATKEATKKYGKAKLMKVVPIGMMYGLTNEEVMKYGHSLNPVTRQPWDSTLTADDKAEIIAKYIKENVMKG